MTGYYFELIKNKLNVVLVYFLKKLKMITDLKLRNKIKRVAFSLSENMIASKLKVHDYS